MEYTHSEIGYNYRLTNIQAAMGCAQMEKLDQYVAAKRAIAQHYQSELAGVPGIVAMAEANWAFSTYWLYTILVDPDVYGMDSRALLRALAKAGVQSRPLWQPLHLGKAHGGCRTLGGETAENLNRQALSLPSSVGLSAESVDRVCQLIRANSAGALQNLLHGFGGTMMEGLVAVIPARGGSKGIPGKNLVPLNGRPLIHYTINAARQSKLIERVFVSTEDTLIKVAALECGAEVIEPPADLAEDETATLPVLQHAVSHLETMGCLPGVIVLLQPTTPYRKAEDIDNAIRMLMDKDADAVVSVVRSETRGIGSSNWSKDAQNSTRPRISRDVRRQVAPQDYRVNGSIYVYRVATIKAATSYAWGRNVYGYVMDKSSSLDIDEPFDLQLAELLLASSATTSNGTSR